MKKRAIQYSMSGILAGAFLFFSLRGVNFSQLLQLIRDANFLWISVMVGIVMISHLFRAVRWRYLLRPIKAQTGLRNLFSGIMVGYLVNNVVPRAGEFVRPYTLARLESMPTGAVLGTVIIERFIDMACLLALLGILPVVYDGPLRETFPWLEQTGIITSVGLGVIAFLIVTLMAKRELTNRLVGKLAHFLPQSVSSKAERVVNSFLDGFKVVRTPRTFVGIAVTSFLIWGLYALMVYAAFWAFDLQSVLGLKAAVVVLAISSIGVILPAPGAIGTYHFFTMQALVNLFSIQQEVALGLATMAHAVNFFSATIIGGYFVVKDGADFSNISRHEESIRTTSTVIGAHSTK